MMQGRFLSIPAFMWAALTLRLIWLSAVAVDPVSDGSMYRDFAYAIASGRGYSYPDGHLTAYWAVGASAFYGWFHYIFGFTAQPMLLLNLAIGLSVVYLTYNISTAYFDERVGLISAWVVAVWPVLIQFTTVYASELIFVFFLLASLRCWKIPSGPKWLHASIWGGLMCAATYVRPTSLPLIFILPVLELICHRNLRAALLALAVALCTAAVLFAPWVYRNQQLLGSPVLVSVNFGTNLWMGNNPQSNGGYMELPDIQFANEVERDQYFKKEAVEFIKANPMQYLKLAVRRVLITYDRETIGVAWNEPALRKLVGDRGLMVIKAVSTAYWWLVLTLAVCGVAVLLWRKKANLLHPLVVVSAFFFVVPILTVGQDRYHMPLNPFLAMFAAVALDAAWKRFSAGRSAGRVVNEPQSV